MDRLIGLPVLLIGLALTWFNKPYARIVLRYTWPMPKALRRSGWMLNVYRAMALIVGVGWVLIGVGVLSGVLTNGSS